MTSTNQVPEWRSNNATETAYAVRFAILPVTCDDGTKLFWKQYYLRGTLYLDEIMNTRYLGKGLYDPVPVSKEEFFQAQFMGSPRMYCDLISNICTTVSDILSRK